MKIKISNELTEQELDNAARNPNQESGFRKAVNAAKTVGVGALGAGAAVVGAIKNIKPREDIRTL